MAQNNQQRSTPPIATNYHQSTSHEQQHRGSPFEFQQIGQNDRYAIQQFSNLPPASLPITGNPLVFPPDYQNQPGFTSSSFKAEDQIIGNPIQTATTTNDYEPSTFRPHSWSISLSEPTKSPVAMSPFMIGAGATGSGGGGTSSNVSESNFTGSGGGGVESGNLSDSQVQMLLQHPFQISSVELAAFHAREMSRSASGSTLLPSSSFQPEQPTHHFHLPAQRLQQYTSNSQRTVSPFPDPSTSSITGMPFAFANQTYDIAPPSQQQQQQRIQFQQGEDNRIGINQSSQLSHGNFTRPNYPSVGQSNTTRTSSNPIASSSSSSSSSSNPYRNITHRRVPAACNFCRMRKLRCDGNTPCRQCARRMIQCVYSEAAETRRQRRATVSTYPPPPTGATTMTAGGKATIMPMLQYTNEQSNRQAHIQSNQRQSWNVNVDQSRAGPSQQTTMQSQQFQQINFVEQQQQQRYPSYRPQLPPSNVELPIQQDRSDIESSSHIAGLPVNWMPVSLHAPHRAFSGGGNTGPQDPTQSNVQKSNQFSIPIYNNDRSNPSPDQRNRFQDANQQQSFQSFQSRKK